MVPIEKALSGYADKFVWLVLAAFFISRAMIKTGLGHRIALIFVRLMGRKTIGLGYSLVFTDFILASFIPSTGARSGGIILPIARSVTETYDSRPEDGTEARLGTFLMTMLYQCEVILCATFLTGQASNVIIAGFARQQAGDRSELHGLVRFGDRSGVDLADGHPDDDLPVFSARDKRDAERGHVRPR